MYELDEEGKSELSDCGGRKKRKDLTWSFVRKRNDEMMFLFVDRGKVAQNDAELPKNREVEVRRECFRRFYLIYVCVLTRR